MAISIKFAVCGALLLGSSLVGIAGGQQHIVQAAPGTFAKDRLLWFGSAVRVGSWAVLYKCLRSS